MQTSYAVLIAAVIIGGVLLYTQRFQVWHDSPTFYVIHDAWTGKFVACRIQALQDANVKISCRSTDRPRVR